MSVCLMDVSLQLHTIWVHCCIISVHNDDQKDRWSCMLYCCQLFVCVCPLSAIQSHYNGLLQWPSDKIGHHLHKSSRDRYGRGRSGSLWAGHPSSMEVQKWCQNVLKCHWCGLVDVMYFHICVFVVLFFFQLELL